MSATWSRSSCRAPRGPEALTTCWPGRPDTAGTWISRAVILSSSRPREPPDDVDVTLLVEPGPVGSLVTGAGAEVWIRTAAAGVQASGTMHRLDGVPLTLQAPQHDDAPTAAAVLTRLLAQVGP